MIAGIFSLSSTSVIAAETSPHDQPSIVDPIHETLATCISHTPIWQLQQRNNCYQNANEQYAVILTKTYAHILTVLPSDKHLLVQKSQQQWTKYRAAWSRLHPQSHATLLEKLHTMQETTEATRTRIIQLLAVWPGLSGEGLSIHSGVLGS